MPEIQPFRIAIPDAELEDLRDRLAHARWSQAEPDGVGWDRGVPRADLQGLARRWANDFDWRAQEAALDAFPQVTTTIDGQTIHAFHVRSAVDGALPLLLLHSWPGSPIEFARMISPLTDPVAHGGAAEDAFDVVVPSLPGFGFSTPLAGVGWSSGRMARAIATLMAELGYERYAVHGGDIGAGVAGSLSGIDPEHVVAVHVTSDAPTAVTFASWSGDPTDHAGLTEADKTRIRELAAWSEDDSGYLKLQTSRPQTIGYALTDSPVGQLAWIAEKFQAWTDQDVALHDAVDIDQLLANISLYWFTRSGASAAQVLYDSMHAQDWGAPGPAAMGFAIFGAEPFVRPLLDPDGRIGHWSEFAVGGHFPAMEQPDLLVDDLRVFLRAYRAGS
jgi:pimeloyl-ACP methyl ester carboxylesterase